MKHLPVLPVLLCAASLALGRPALHASEAGPSIHPAVVRVIVTDRDGTSFGSGALVAADNNYGLIVTNWHVVRDVGGPITVLFPDGFGSLATVLRVNREWDLAALAIRRPNVRPIPLAGEAPRPGEVLTIAGYGKGWYRATSGSCTQYLSPGGNLPNELVELAATAREGDSGGPILNSRGELAGVLFGTGFGYTMGSYCGRVRWFLDSTANDFNRLPDRATMLAQRSQPAAPPVAAIPASAAMAGGAWPAGVARLERSDGRGAAGVMPTVAPSGYAQAQDGSAAASRSSYNYAAPITDLSAPPSGPTRTITELDPTRMPASLQPAEPSRYERVKTILAALGVLFLLFQSLRLVGRVAG